MLCAKQSLSVGWRCVLFSHAWRVLEAAIPKTRTPQIAQAKKPDVSQDIMAKMESAKEKLISARTDLTNSGGEWGGFRESAI